MAPMTSEPLQRLLEAELAAGNEIVEDSSGLGWGKLTRLVILDQPFRSKGWEGEPQLAFREINDPHYWKEEVEDVATEELVACRFGAH